jgi:hypothetical protein
LQNYQDQRHELLVTTSLHDIKVRFHWLLTKPNC